MTLHSVDIKEGSYSSSDRTLVTETYNVSWPTKKYKVYEIDSEEYLSLTEIIESNKDVLKTKREIRFCNGMYECLRYHLYDPNVELKFGQDCIALKEISTVYRIVFMAEKNGMPQDKTEIITPKPTSRFLPLLAGISFVAVLCGILYFIKRK